MMLAVFALFMAAVLPGSVEGGAQCKMINFTPQPGPGDTADSDYYKTRMVDKVRHSQRSNIA